MGEAGTTEAAFRQEACRAALRAMQLCSFEPLVNRIVVDAPVAKIRVYQPRQRDDVEKQ